MSQIETTQQMTITVPIRDYIVIYRGSEYPSTTFETINGIIRATKEGSPIAQVGWDVEYIPRRRKTSQRIRLSAAERGHA